MAEQFVGTGWAFPLRIGPTGGIALVSGEREIEEAMRLVLATAPGERPMRPEFGCAIHDMVFAPVNEATAGRIQHEVHASLDRWEPRIEVEDVEVTAGDDQGVLFIDVRYSIRGTNNPRSLVFPFYVIPSHDEPDRAPGPGTGHRKRPLMALPSPNLDDRRFQQFVDDAKRYIQQRAPEWTDHNVSDPGVTLVETVAHMADQIVYRLNRVPEKNHLAFLDLIGITLFPPSAARADVTFWLSAPLEEPVRLPVGTEVATARTESEEAVVFATERELTVVPCDVGVPRGAAQRASRSSTAPRTSPRARTCCASPSPRGPATACCSGSAPPSRTARWRSRWTAGSTASAWTPGSRRWSGRPGPRTAGPPARSTGTAPADSTAPARSSCTSPAATCCPAPGGSEAGWLRCRVTEPAARPALLHHLAHRALAPRRSPSAAPPAPCTPRRSATRRWASPPGCPASGCGWPTPPSSATSRRCTSRSAEDDGWTDWEVVPHFAASGPDDRHFTLDAATGEIAFGTAVREPDGTLRQYGAVPPKGAAIRARRYRTGGGRAGNVARGAIQVLRNSVPYVSEVVNREAATRRGRRRDRRGGQGPRPHHAARPGPRRDPARLRGTRPPRRARRPPASPAWRATRSEHGAHAVRVLVVPQAVPDPGGRLRFEQLVPGDALLERITRLPRRTPADRHPAGRRPAVLPGRHRRRHACTPSAAPTPTGSGGRRTTPSTGTSTR